MSSDAHLSFLNEVMTETPRLMEESGESPSLILSQAQQALRRDLLRPLKGSDTDDALQPGAAASSQVDLSIVSYNLLLPAFETRTYYRHIPLLQRRWKEHRLTQTIELFLQIGADLYLIQEGGCDTWVEDFSQALGERGYGFIAPRNDMSGKKRREMEEALRKQHDEVDNAGEIGIGANKSDPEPFKLVTDVAKCGMIYRKTRLKPVWEDHRSRVVLAAFEVVHDVKNESGENRLLYACSAHLEGAPEAGATRVAQVRKALEKVEKQILLRSGDSCLGSKALEKTMLVFAGDFNETANDSLSNNTITAGASDNADSVPTTAIEALRQSLFGPHLADLYAPYASHELFPQGRPATFSCRDESDSEDELPSAQNASEGADRDLCPVTASSARAQFSAIDFMWYTGQTLEATHVRLPLTKEQTADVENVSFGLPCCWHSSDHVPVGGVFRIGRGSDTSRVASDHFPAAALGLERNANCSESTCSKPRIV